MTSATISDLGAENCLAGGGEIGALMRAIDWSKTPIANRFPLLLWWGPQYVSIYNDSYRPILGKKHPKIHGATR